MQLERRGNMVEALTKHAGIVKLVIATLATVGLLACEVDMSISIDGKNPPSFSLTGSGKLISFGVTEVLPSNQKQTIQRRSDTNVPLWSIVPVTADSSIRRLSAITYGKVPAGFAQQFPADGS